jgi:hypothetical protein
MSNFYVTTKVVEPIATIEERELIQALPADSEIENRFPFDDLDRKKVEVFKIGSRYECQEYINSMPSEIMNFFKIEQF